MKKSLFVIMLLLLQGCATPFQQYYHDLTGGTDYMHACIVSEGEPNITHSIDSAADTQRMLEEGYFLIGYSSFNAPNAFLWDLTAKAKQVKAGVVLYYKQYTNTVTGSYQVTSPTTETSTTTMNGSVFGSGGFGTYSGTANTTTTGTTTTNVPYSINRYEYLATYWIKKKMPVLGIQCIELPTEIRQKIGSNKGLLVIAVVKESPAFHADILKGDVIKKIGDIEPYDIKTLPDITEKYAGQKVQIELIRDGKEIHKDIQFNQTPE